MPLTDADPLIKAAERAFHAGDWEAARAQLEAAADARPANADLFAMLATACLRLGDEAAGHQAADRALTLNARNLRAVLAKADLLSKQGARREANLYYGAVVDIGAAAASLPSDLAEGVIRARAIRERLAADMQGLVQEELAQAGYSESRSHPRFTHALDILTGRRQPYFQQPEAFYYPELPNTQFYPREQFPWLDAVEAATDAMTEELALLLQDDAAFAPYIQTQPGLPNRPDYPLIDSMDWSSAFLWKDGQETPNAARCPRTMAALADAPLCRIRGRSPQIMFSQLKAGAHIRPHHGFVNTRLICHVPLIVPPGCRFRVGNDVRNWEKGKAWVFDDTIEHEAQNASDRTRVVLIFDIWRPELSEEERELVTTLLETLDAYSPRTTTWE
ncbi:MAG: aspartyl/asparaginyl beta-hydroxylase domain-containing protein [Brevundimonas sp.]